MPERPAEESAPPNEIEPDIGEDADGKIDPMPEVGVALQLKVLPEVKV